MSQSKTPTWQDEVDALAFGLADHQGVCILVFGIGVTERTGLFGANGTFILRIEKDHQFLFAQVFGEFERLAKRQGRIGPRKPPAGYPPPRHGPARLCADPAAGVYETALG